MTRRMAAPPPKSRRRPSKSVPDGLFGRELLKGNLIATLPPSEAAPNRERRSPRTHQPSCAVRLSPASGTAFEGGLALPEDRAPSYPSSPSALSKETTR